MQINFSNDKPIFIQFSEIIKSDIISGKLKTGDKLPSVRELAFKYSINPNTVQKALQILEDDRLIITDRTNGKYVADSSKLISKHKEKLISHEAQIFIEKMQGLGLNLKEIKEIINNIGE